ncbi:hypothetical protein J8I29_01555 [Labrys sp. LIt4]|uniref:hypothetical protein n=1 Tax=Labrys sp. LIt4 TaxID=2821355 RepID=UPI001AE08F36|nr:hypothetical protein [Labrys sp. LIt4]MBP0577982.1 hypothetical protein [Labrys sp. LIt4]
MHASRIGRDITKAAVTAFAVYALLVNSLLMGVLMAPQLRADTLDRNLAALEIVCAGNGMGITDAGSVPPADHRGHEAECCILCPGFGGPASPAGIDLPRRLSILAALAPWAADSRIPPSLHRAAAHPRGPPMA